MVAPGHGAQNDLRDPMNGEPCAATGPEEQRALHHRVLETAHKLNQAVSAELDMERLCDLVVEQLTACFSPHSLALLFLDEATGELSVKRQTAPSPGKKEPPLAACSSDSAAAVALAEQRSVVLRDGDPLLQRPTLGEPFAQPQALVAVPLTSSTDSSPPAERTPSTAAVPLVAERKVKGVLALTWKRGEGRPTDDDVRMLDILASQAAAAIDNAWLYGELKNINASLEGQVQARTTELAERNRELATALQELQRTQAQMVQNEKMVSLGQLTAGVAHEINNPLAYAINNLAMVQGRLRAEHLQLDLLTAQADMARAKQDDAALEAGHRFVEKLERDGPYTDDIEAFRADLKRLPPAEQLPLMHAFLGYVREREAQTHAPDTLGAGTSRLLDGALDGLERVKAIVLDLRSFSRLDEADFQLANVDAGIASTLSIVSHMARDKGVSLRHEAGITAGPYACFPAKLNQVVLNLLTNAVQATNEGGSVIISSRESAAGPRIEVTDTGKGIPPEHMNRIFDPFFTTKPVGSGTGLGLSISYKIIEEHGGTLTADSRVDQGARFCIQLPPRKGQGNTDEP